METVKPTSSISFILPCRLLATSAALVMGIVHSYSQGVVYTDRSLFNTALQTSTTIDFEGLPPYDGFGTGQSPITVLRPTFPFNTILTVTNLEHRLFVAGSGMLNPTPGTGQYIWNFDSSYPIGISFPGGRNAFAADFSGGIVQNNPFNATLTFNLLGGQTYIHNFTGQMGEWTFRGFAFSQSITSVIYSDGGPFLPGAHEEMIDNVTYGVAVPEPQVISTVASAALLCLALRRRRLPTAYSKNELTSAPAAMEMMDSGKLKSVEA